MTAHAVQQRAATLTAMVIAVRSTAVTQLLAVAMLPQISPMRTAQAAVRELARSTVKQAAMAPVTAQARDASWSAADESPRLAGPVAAFPAAP